MVDAAIGKVRTKNTLPTAVAARQSGRAITASAIIARPLSSSAAAAGPAKVNRNAETRSEVSSFVFISHNRHRPGIESSRNSAYAAARLWGLPPSNRAGRKSTARINANTAPKVIPINRNGSESSHTNGKRISASTASGQHSTKRIRNNSSFTVSLRYCG